MDRFVYLAVYGQPAPQGSKKFLGRTKTGKGIITDASSATAPWRADVKAACETWMRSHDGWIPFSCAVSVSMVFTFARPKTVTRKKRPFPSVYPDLGKLARATEDAISASGLWADDALVVEYARLAKVYAGEDVQALSRPGCSIGIQEKKVQAVPLSGKPADLLAIEARSYEWPTPRLTEEEEE